MKVGQLLQLIVFISNVSVIETYGKKWTVHKIKIRKKPTLFIWIKLHNNRAKIKDFVEIINLCTSSIFFINLFNKTFIMLSLNTSSSSFLLFIAKVWVLKTFSWVLVNTIWVQTMNHRWNKDFSGFPISLERIIFKPILR